MSSGLFCRYPIIHSNFNPCSFSCLRQNQSGNYVLQDVVAKIHIVILINKVGWENALVFLNLLLEKFLNIMECSVTHSIIKFPSSLTVD